MTRLSGVGPRLVPSASRAFVLYGHQKRGIWRIISSGSTYLAHAVGAGKTMTMAAAIMEQRRLGLIAKAFAASAAVSNSTLGPLFPADGRTLAVRAIV